MKFNQFCLFFAIKVTDWLGKKINEPECQRKESGDNERNARRNAETILIFVPSSMIFFFAREWIVIFNWIHTSYFWN